MSIKEKFTNILPIIFDPIYIRKPWGGNKLTGDNFIGEAFLISDFKNHSTKADGKTVKDFLDYYGDDFFGKEIVSKYGRVLPIYLKELDAANHLSIQVHPNNIFAKKLEGENFGKNEAWYILEAEKGAGLYLGLKSKVNRNNLEKALHDKEDISKLLNFVPVREGDFFYVPSGLVHAIGKGVRLLEPQQNSNTTYRVWDWNRVNDRGEKRELHIDKALKVINFDSDFNSFFSKPVKLNKKNIFLDNDIFKIESLSLKKDDLILEKKSVYRLIVLTHDSMEINFGGSEVKTLKRGRVCFLPAFVEKPSLSATQRADFLIITVK